MFFTVNEKVIADPSAAVSALDRGFLLGDGIFETLRIYNGRPFKLRAHLDRLALSARRTGMPVPATLEDFCNSEVERATAARLVDAYFRITLTRGTGLGLGAEPEAATLATVIAPLPATDPALYSAGIRVTVATGRRNEFSQSAGIKTIAYLDSILAFRSAKGSNSEDALFLDTEGHLSEATASNVFVYLDGRLYTPPTSCGALPGITRATVIEIAADEQIPVVDDRPIDAAILNRASEIFLTSSVREIVPVSAVDGREVSSGMPGPVTFQIMRAYAVMPR